MKIQQFKNLIKECVREVIVEELPSILEEHLSSNGELLQENDQTFSFSAGDVMKRPGADLETVRNTLRSRVSSGFAQQGQQQQYKDLKPQPQAENPLLAFILDAGKNMDARDISSLRNI